MIENRNTEQMATVKAKHWQSSVITEL